MKAVYFCIFLIVNFISYKAVSGKLSFVAIYPDGQEISGDDIDLMELLRNKSSDMENAPGYNGLVEKFYKDVDSTWKSVDKGLIDDDTAIDIHRDLYFRFLQDKLALLNIKLHVKND